MAAPVFSQKDPEFSRIFRLDRASRVSVEETIEAQEDECEALAKRFGLPRIARLSADWTISPLGAKKFQLSGRLVAEYDQTCVVSLEVFSSSLDVTVSRVFFPALPAQEALALDEEYDLAHHGEIDLGEIAAEEFSLALDPYPKKDHTLFFEETPFGRESLSQEHPLAGLKKILFESTQTIPSKTKKR